MRFILGTIAGLTLIVSGIFGVPNIDTPRGCIAGGVILIAISMFLDYFGDDW